MSHLAPILRQNVIGKLLNHGIVFLINICIVRYLGATQSGYYFNELYLFNFAVFIFSLGLDYAAIAWISREPGLLQIIHRRLFRLTLFSLVMMSLILLIILPLLNVHFKQSHWAVLLFSTGNLLLIFYQGILTAQKKFNLQNVLLCSTNLLFLFALLFFLNENNPEKFTRFALLYGGLFFLQGLLMFFFSFSESVSGAYTVNWSHFFKHGFFIMLSSLVYFAFLRIDNFYVEKFSDAVTLSNYVLCGKIGQYFLYFSSVVSSTLLPYMNASSISGSFSEWKKVMKPYVLLILLAVFLVACTGKWIFPWLFGNGFDKMYLFILILLPGYFCLSMLTLFNAVYIGKGNISKIFRGDLLGLLLVIVFDSILVPYYGAVAASIISSAAYCIVFVYLWRGFKEQFDAPHE